MRLRQAVRRVRNTEVAVLRVGAQAVGLEILLAVMADRDALLRPNLLGRLGLWRRNAPRLRLDGLAGCGFGCRLVARPFLLHSGLRRGARRDFLLGHGASPFLFMAGGYHKFLFVGWVSERPNPPPNVRCMEMRW